MTTYSLTTRATKGSALTHTEMDNNLNAMLRKIGDNATLRAAPPENGVRVWQECYATAGDGGHGAWRGVTGAAAATYTHNGGTVTVPTGGDGSAAWLREYDGIIRPEWFSGADASLQIIAAIAALPSTGGTVDARNYTGTQTVSSTITVGTASKPVKFLVNTDAVFQPAAVDTQMFTLGPQGIIDGLSIDCTNVAYVGAAVRLYDSFTDGQITRLTNTKMVAAATGGTGLQLLTPGAVPIGIAFVSFSHIRIDGFYIGINLNAANATTFINSNHFSDVKVKNNHISILLDGAGANDANLFVNLTLQAGADSITGIEISRGEHNQFVNTNIWDWPTTGSEYELVLGANAWYNLVQGRLDLKHAVITNPMSNTVIDTVNNSPAVVTYTASTTWDPASIADGDKEAKDISVTGAEMGDFAIASLSIDLQDLVLDAQVTSAGTVTCVLANNTGGAVDLGSATLYVRTFKK